MTITFTISTFTRSQILSQQTQRLTYHHRQNDANRAEEPHLSLQLDFSDRLLLVCHFSVRRERDQEQDWCTLYRFADTVNSDSKFNDTSLGLLVSLFDDGDGGGGLYLLLWTATANSTHDGSGLDHATEAIEWVYHRQSFKSGLDC